MRVILILIFSIIQAFHLYGLHLKTGDKVVLVNKYGKFATSNQNVDGEINSNAELIGNWEWFNVNRVNDSLFQLKDNFGHYLNYENHLYYSKSGGSYFKITQFDKKNYLKTEDDYFFECSNDKLIKNKLAKELIVFPVLQKNHFRGYISNKGILFLSIGILFFLLLFIFQGFFKKMFHENITYLLILIAQLSVGIFAITEFDFLGVWDEQYHALVGKNLGNNWTIPLLYKVNSFVDSMIWAETTVWLHKQPLFLYQIALSTKLFGINELAVRIPSLILCAFCGVAIYRVGLLIFSKYVGLFASLFFCFSFYKLTLLMGLQELDQNDVVFISWAFLSIWAYVEFYFAKKYKRLFLIFIGVFAGFAILTKWLVGLLVYLIWGIGILIEKKGFKAIFNAFIPLVKSLLITLAVMLPWQLYILIKYPEIASYEYQLNFRHLFEIIENHSGKWNYHLELIETHYHLPVSLFIFFLFFSIWDKIKNKFTLPFFLSILFVYLLYSFAATKMPSFTFVVAPLILILLAASFETIQKSILNDNDQSLSKKILSFIVFPLIIASHFIAINQIENYIKEKKTKNEFILHRRVATSKFKTMQLELEKNSILFNCGDFNSILAMFYLNDIEAHDFIPSIDQLEKVLNLKNKVYIFNNGKLPDYLINKENIVLIDNF